MGSVAKKIPRLDLKWQNRAVCADVADPSIFFPPDIGGQVAAQQAFKVCRICPVRMECLDYAFKTNQQYGIWGGLTARRRSYIVTEVRNGQNPELTVGKPAGRRRKLRDAYNN